MSFKYASNDNRYQQLPDEPRIGNNLMKLQGDLRTIRNLVKQIGTKQDSMSHRELIMSHINKFKQAALEAKNIMNTLHSMPPAQQKKLVGDLNTLSNEFQILVRDANREMTRVPVSRFSAASSGNMLYDSPLTASEQRALLAEEQRKRNEEAQLNLTIEIETENLAERAQALSQIETDMAQIQDMFQEMALMVSDQGFMIDDIESNIVTADTNTKEGYGQLQTASQYQKGTRKKLCFCALFFAIVLVVVILVFTKKI